MTREMDEQNLFAQRTRRGKSPDLRLFCSPLTSGLGHPSPLCWGRIPIEETELHLDAVQPATPTVMGHLTHLLRSLRLMLARTVRIRLLFQTAVLCALWIAAPPCEFAFGQPPSSEKTNIQSDDTVPTTGDDDKSLPAGLIQNRQVLPEMEIEKEMYSDGDEKDFLRKYKSQYEKALQSTSLTDEEKKALDAGAIYWVYRFSMKKYREEELPKKDERGVVIPQKGGAKERLPDLRKKLLDFVKVYAKSTVAREYFLKQIVAECEKLLDNNFVVRQNIILLLGQLSSTYPPPGKPIDPTPYDAAYVVLLKVIKDPKQHEALKIDALIGLTRICRAGLPLPDANNDRKRAEIALILVPELARKNTFWWYQARLAECLGAAGVTYDPANKTNPIVVQTLAEVVADPQRHFQARVEAAKSIGRLPLDNQLNMAPVVHHIVNLGYQIAQAHNANPKKEPWRDYYFTLQPQLGFGLYYAFRSESGSAKIAGGKRKPGLLEAFPTSKEVKEAYEQFLMMALHFINNPGTKLADAQLKSIDDWLKSHVPGNARITDSSPPLSPKAPSPANPKGAAPESSPALGSQ